MAMTQKHYRETAAAIRVHVEAADYLPESGAAVLMTARCIANDLAVMFKADSSRFNRQEFMEACGLGE